MKNFFTEPVRISFQEAIGAMLAGKRIRRKSERKGYVKVITIIGEKKTDTFGTYWMSNPDDISDYCSFDVQDVFANDWMVEESHA